MIFIVILNYNNYIPYKFAINLPYLLERTAD